MKKENKIRSNFVKDSLDSYTKLAATINENTENTVRQMLDEAVKNAYAKILSEDEDYDVDEVEDTENDTELTDTNVTDDDNNGTDSDTTETDDATEDVQDTTEVKDDQNDDEESWSEFSKYEVNDGKYDLSQAEDEEIVKVYKLLKADDEVIIKKNDDNVEIKDNETGAEYIIDLGGDDDNSNVMADTEDVNDDEEDTFEVELDGDDTTEDDNIEDEIDNEEDMNESRIFEVVLQEYNSNVGYTDNYQNKDVMTTDGVQEPNKKGNDWDAGVPKDTKKPWSGKKNNNSENKPFTAEKGKQLEEEMDNVDAGEETIDEAGHNVGGFVQQNSTSMSQIPNSKGRKARNASKAGVKVNGTSVPRYSTEANEAIVKKANNIFKENKELKKALTEFKTILEEAAVTNFNLGQIIKLITENSTSQDEKKNIIERFGESAKTINESKNLYKTISNELKNREKVLVAESKDFTVDNKKMVNETKIYQSKEIMDSLELMNKICK